MFNDFYSNGNDTMTYMVTLDEVMMVIGGNCNYSVYAN